MIYEVPRLLTSRVAPRRVVAEGGVTGIREEEPRTLIEVPSAARLTSLVAIAATVITNGRYAPFP